MPNHTLFSSIDKFRPPERALNRPVRLVISDIFKSVGGSSGCCLAGRLESGMIQTADKILVMPLNEVIQIKSKSFTIYHFVQPLISQYFYRCRHKRHFIWFLLRRRPGGVNCEWCRSE